mmetsp:Transcript_1641/g.2364  ORF Transcript_1641/g.2364 Transcript_1641/m.2364 type:complete len:83 (+) Transcript_1641:58-306(+)
MQTLNTISNFDNFNNIETYVAFKMLQKCFSVNWQHATSQNLKCRGNFLFLVRLECSRMMSRISLEFMHSHREMNSSKESQID